MNELSNIKMANESDAYDIALINALCWQTAYRNIIPDQVLDNISVKQWALGWKNSLQNNAKVFVIYKEDRLVGYAQICKTVLQNSIQAELNSIYLHPDFWGKGLGKKLYLASLFELQRLGYKEIFIWVLAQNIRARKFYEAMGLIESGSSRCWNVIPRLHLIELQYINKISQY